MLPWCGPIDEMSAATVALRFALAFVFSGVIGMERGRKGRAAGLRTYILVGIGSAMTAMIGLFASDIMLRDTDPLRISAQVISGIGFLGVGTILVTGRTHVRGLTTAAGLWTTATIGLAVGMGFYVAALICTLLAVVTIVCLNGFENIVIGKNNNIEIYIEISNAYMANSTIAAIGACAGRVTSVDIIPPRSGIADHLGVDVIMRLPRKLKKQDVIERITKLPDVVLAVESN